jgi:hypothetical protein
MTQTDRDTPVTALPRTVEAGGDPYQWLHDNDFSWDDVNAIAAILEAGGFAITLPEADTISDDRDARNRLKGLLGRDDKPVFPETDE